MDHTSSNGRVSLKQLSHTSFTARSAVALSGHAGLAATESIARRRTQAWQKHGNRRQNVYQITPPGRPFTWCCFENATMPRRSSREKRQSPLKLFARIYSGRKSASLAAGIEREMHPPHYMRGVGDWTNPP